MISWFTDNLFKAIGYAVVFEAVSEAASFLSKTTVDIIIFYLETAYRDIKTVGSCKAEKVESSHAIVDVSIQRASKPQSETKKFCAANKRFHAMRN